MKVITAPEEYRLKNDEISVFLAGGITDCFNWQDDIIEILSHLNSDKLVVFNPRRENFPIHDPSASYKQIEWEFKALENADIFSMYFASGESVQPICMYELGRNLARMQIRKPIDWKDRIVISVEDGYKRKQDVLIQTELACGSIPFVTTLPAQISESVLRDYHAGNIVKSYLKLIN